MDPESNSILDAAAVDGKACVEVVPKVICQAP
jgi:hypothetical protein